MTERISELFDYGDEIVVDGLESPFDPARIKEITMNRIHEHTDKHSRVRVRRISRTLLLAAILSTLFVTSALAVGLSIHSRRQAELNETVAQGGAVAGYTEYAVPSEDGGSGVTLLSALSDGAFEYLWLNVAPVGEDELICPLVGVETENGRVYRNIAYRLKGEEEISSSLGIADMLRFEPEDWVETADGGRTVPPERMEQRYREQYYDAETKTMTVRVAIPMRDLTPGEPTELELFMKTYGEGFEQAAHKILGTLRFTPVAEEALDFFFPVPWDFENPETGGKGQILGIELVASGVNTYVTHEDIETVYTDDPAHRNVLVADGQTERWVSWANAEEQTVRENMHLNLSDGSMAEIGGYLASGGREGSVEKLLSSGRSTLWDIHSIVSVTVGENTWEIPGHN